MRLLVTAVFAIGVVGCARAVQHSKRAIADDFGEKLMKPYIEYKMDTSIIKHDGKRLKLDRYWMKNFSYNQAYKLLGDPLTKAGWTQLGGLDYAIDSRVCGWTSSNGRFYMIAEFATSKGFEFDAATPAPTK